MTPVNGNLNVSESYLNETQDNRVIENINQRLEKSNNEMRGYLAGLGIYDGTTNEQAINSSSMNGQVIQNNLLLRTAITTLMSIPYFVRKRRFFYDYGYDEGFWSDSKDTITFKRVW